MNIKECTKCKETKLYSEFYTRTKIADGKKYLMSECKDCSKVRARDCYRIKKNQDRLRERVFDLLGHICGYCGFSDKRALQVDHVYNNGYEERKKYKGHSMLRKILKGNGDGYQILCANCNWIKRVEHIDSERKLNTVNEGGLR